jgi:hypothetical protein
MLSISLRLAPDTGTLLVPYKPGALSTLLTALVALTGWSGP